MTKRLEHILDQIRRRVESTNAIGEIGVDGLRLLTITLVESIEDNIKHLLT